MFHTFITDRNLSCFWKLNTQYIFVRHSSPFLKTFIYCFYQVWWILCDVFESWRTIEPKRSLSKLCWIFIHSMSTICLVFVIRMDSGRMSSHFFLKINLLFHSSSYGLNLRLHICNLGKSTHKKESVPKIPSNSYKFCSLFLFTI